MMKEYFEIEASKSTPQYGFRKELKLFGHEDDNDNNNNDNKNQNHDGNNHSQVSEDNIVGNVSYDDYDNYDGNSEDIHEDDHYPEDEENANMKMIMLMNRTLM